VVEWPVLVNIKSVGQSLPIPAQVKRTFTVYSKDLPELWNSASLSYSNKYKRNEALDRQIDWYAAGLPRKHLGLIQVLCAPRRFGCLLSTPEGTHATRV
jgi:hypothetical protein